MIMNQSERKRENILKNENSVTVYFLYNRQDTNLVSSFAFVFLHANKIVIKFVKSRQYFQIGVKCEISFTFLGECHKNSQYILNDCTTDEKTYITSACSMCEIRLPGHFSSHIHYLYVLRNICKT